MLRLYLSCFIGNDQKLSGEKLCLPNDIKKEENILRNI